MLRVLVLLTMLLTAAAALSQDQPEGRRSAKKDVIKKDDLKKNDVKKVDVKRDATKKDAKKDAKENIPVTSEREAAVNAFVERHHPELAELLKHLKGNKNARQYERAIRDLYAVSERLADFQKSDNDRYELELKAWKLKSRIQLLSARLTMSDNEELKYELKQALAEQYDLRREVLSLEKNRLHERVQKLERELIDYDSRRESALEKQFQQLTTITTPKSKPAAGKVKTEKPAKNTVAP